MRTDGNFDDRIHERLRWRSRRGLLELDLILTRFLAARLETLSSDEIRLFDEVLRLSDNDFLDIVMGRTECKDDHLKPLVEMIRAA